MKQRVAYALLSSLAAATQKSTPAGPHPRDPAWTIVASECDQCGQLYVDAATRAELRGSWLTCPDCDVPLKLTAKVHPELYMPLEDAERYADRLIDSGWPEPGSGPLAV